MIEEYQDRIKNMKEE